MIFFFVFSILSVLAGVTGSFFHLRGTLRRPGAREEWFYKLMYGPPPFAPMLFAASGFFGLLAIVMKGSA